VTSLSIVIPVYNEAASLRELQNEIATSLAFLQDEYEVIYVDDGSCDSSWNIIRELALARSHVTGLRLRRNSGQSIALSAGFDHCNADIVVSLDADLQNDPRDILRLLARLKEGYDVVCGWRQEREDPFWGKRLPSWLSNWLARRISGLSIHDFGCTLRAYSIQVVREVPLYGELHRFLPALAVWMGFKVTEESVNHRPRKHGQSKYGTGRIVRGGLDLVSVYLLERYMSRPLHLFGVVGFLLAFIGIVSGAWLLIERLFFGQPLANRPVVLLPIVLVLVGLQLFLSGVLGDMIRRTAYHSGIIQEYSIIETVGSPTRRRASSIRTGTGGLKRPVQGTVDS
jgi:glycosyltransferase involved in cell wall biosynthesis